MYAYNLFFLGLLWSQDFCILCFTKVEPLLTLIEAIWEWFYLPLGSNFVNDFMHILNTLWHRDYKFKTGSTYVKHNIAIF